jgi:WD40 repeat protein
MFDVSIAAVTIDSSYAKNWILSFSESSFLLISKFCCLCSTGKLLVTCGKDGTVRVWMADRGKEISRHVFQSPQTCICISQANVSKAHVPKSCGALAWKMTETKR